MARPASRHQALDFYLTDLLAKYQKWLVESPAKIEIRLDNTGSTMKEMIARQVMDGCFEDGSLVLFLVGQVVERPLLRILFKTPRVGVERQYARR